tara:strand:- start:272 stop:637 length:366 start_codon:yes stop_codon:yes gene_type:complete
MSTRAQIRFATREDGVSFSEHPKKINAQFYVHSDGYPEGLGIEIAESYEHHGKVKDWELEDLCTEHGDLEYIYYIWQVSGKATWISIFEVKPFQDQVGECIFVGTPYILIERYKLNTNKDI